MRARLNDEWVFFITKIWNEKVTDYLQIENSFEISKFRRDSRIRMITVWERYARRDVNEERVFTVDTSVLEFWCPLYHFGMSNLGLV